MEKSHLQRRKYYWGEGVGADRARVALAMMAHPRPIVRILPALLVFRNEIIYLGPIAAYVCCSHSIRADQSTILFKIEWIQCRIGGAEHCLTDEIEAMLNVIVGFAINNCSTHHVETMHLVEHRHAKLSCVGS